MGASKRTLHFRRESPLSARRAIRDMLRTITTFAQAVMRQEDARHATGRAQKCAQVV